MAKKINFALEMADGYAVRHELEEYRAHFDLKKAIEHFTSGKLVEWLENNFYEEEAEAINQLDADAPDFQRRLCETLGVELPETEGEEQDVDTIKRTQEKESLLRQKTSDDSVIANAAKTAFNRSDLVALWRAGEKTIYLCGDTFDIPIGDKTRNTKYIGVLGTPIIKIKAKSPEELKDKGIAFENVELPEYLREKKPEEIKPCPKCGHENSATAKFCNECGASIIGQEKTTAPSNEKVWRIAKKKLKLLFVNTFSEEFRNYEANPNVTFLMVNSKKNEPGPGIVDFSPEQKNTALSLICAGEYTEDDLIHLRIDCDMARGWAFTRDSFCIVDEDISSVILYESLADIPKIDKKYVLEKIWSYSSFGSLLSSGKCPVLSSDGILLPDGSSAIWFSNMLTCSTLRDDKSTDKVLYQYLDTLKNLFCDK